MARAAPFRRRPMRRGHARGRGKPRLFLSAPRGSRAFFREAAPRPRLASALLGARTFLPPLRRLPLSSSFPLFLFSRLSLSLFGIASRSRFSLCFFLLFLLLLFLLLLVSGRRFFSRHFLFVARARFCIAAKKKRGKGRKNGRKSAGASPVKINCSPRGRSIRPKAAAGAGAFRALRKAKPPRGLAAHPQAPGAARLDAVWGVSSRARI